MKPALILIVLLLTGCDEHERLQAQRANMEITALEKRVQALEERR